MAVAPFAVCECLDEKPTHSLCNFLSCLLLTSTSSFSSLSASRILQAAIGPVETNTSQLQVVVFSLLPCPLSPLFL